MDQIFWPILALENVTDDSFLWGWLYVLQLESYTGATIDLDAPINSLFVEGNINESDYTLSASLFCMIHGLNLTEQFLDFTLTTREFVAMLKTLPKMNADEFKEAYHQLAVAVRMYRDKN